MKYYYLFLALSLVLGSTNYVAAQHKYAKVVIKSHKGKSFKMKIDKKSVYPRNAKRLVMMMKTMRIMLMMVAMTKTMPADQPDMCNGTVCRLCVCVGCA